MTKRYCLTLDLKDDEQLISRYEACHREVWPEVLHSIRDSGIKNMEIYRLHTRLFMILEVAGDFSFERKAELDRDNAKVQEWEQLMWQFQQPLKEAAKGEKWMLMNRIFHLQEPAAP